MYASDHNDLFPRAESNPYNCMVAWGGLIVATGYAPSQIALDPDFTRAGSRYPTYGLSMCAVYDPDLMVRHHTVPRSEWKSKDVRRADVFFPSQKGILWRWWNEEHPNEFARWCCPARNAGVVPPPFVGPVSMGDLAVLTGVWTDFLTDQYVLENDIGMPVESTWLGCRGRDRR